ncbi:MAG TPA: non-heme iron oxygenase ferredoxin subunit [Longimicrobiales bacterium]
MAEWVRVAAASECPPGSLKGVRAGGEDLVLANVDGDFYALEDRCSHEDLPLSDGDLEGSRLECIYHGAVFDTCDGSALGLPAVTPVRVFEVEVRDGEVYVQVGG